jgi:hypothetical protein
MSGVWTQLLPVGQRGGLNGPVDAPVFLASQRDHCRNVASATFGKPPFFGKS